MIAAVLFIAMQFVLVRTALARRIFAVGVSPDAASNAGVNVGRTRLSAFVLSGLLAGAAGVLLAARLGSVQAFLGVGYEFIAIAGAVLGGVSLAGGRGSVWAAVVSGLMLATLQQGLRLMGVDPVHFSIVTGLCIVAGVVFDRLVQRFALSRVLKRSIQEFGTSGYAFYSRPGGGRADDPRQESTTTISAPPARPNLPQRSAVRMLLDPTLGVAVLLLTVCLVSIFVLPEFLTVANLIDLGSSITVMILAMGMTVVLISGGIDLSVGAVMALCAGVTANVLLMGLPLFAAFIAAGVVGSSPASATGLLVTRLKLPDFIETLAMLGFASGILYVWTGGVPIIGYMVPEYYYVGGLTPLLGSLTVPMLVALVLALLLGDMLGKTRLGTHLFGRQQQVGGPAVRGAGRPDQDPCVRDQRPDGSRRRDHHGRSQHECSGRSGNRLRDPPIPCLQWLPSGWRTGMVFVPGRDGDEAPYGIWDVVYAWIDRRWRDHADSPMTWRSSSWPTRAAAPRRRRSEPKSSASPTRSHRKRRSSAIRPPRHSTAPVCARAPA